MRVKIIFEDEAGRLISTAVRDDLAHPKRTYRFLVRMLERMFDSKSDEEKSGTEET